MSNKIKIMIIILNYNSSQETLNLIKLLSNQSYNFFEIIVIDNHSKDDSLSRLSKCTGSIKLIKNKKNLGYAGGNNIGISIAIEEHVDYVWILNPDIRPDVKALSILIDSMEKDLSIAAIGPRICYSDNPEIVYSDGGFLYPEKGFLVVHKNHNKKIKDISSHEVSFVDYANGSAILIRVKALVEIGKFREDFFLYYEETDWCLRVKQKGWNVATNSNAIVYHSSSQKGVLYHFFMARNRLLLAKVRGTFRLLAVGTELDYLLRFLKIPTYHNLLYFTARFAGILCGLIKIPSKNYHK